MNSHLTIGHEWAYTAHTLACIYMCAQANNVVCGDIKLGFLGNNMLEVHGSKAFIDDL